MAKLLLLVSLLVFSSVALNAQADKIDTDRPDQTEGVYTVPAGWIQGELGFSKEKFDHGSYTHNYWTLPTLLTRYGLSGKWELRLVTEYVRVGNQRRLFSDTIGLLPIQLGFKVNLLEENGIIPGIALLGHSGFNRLSSRLAPGHGGTFFAPAVTIAFQNSLSEKSAIGYNLGVEWEETNEPPAFIYTFTPGFSLGEKWYVYAEIFGSFMKNEKAQHTLDAGLAYNINNNIKVDLSGGVGIAGNAPKNYIAAGFSFRCNTRKK